jgi:regulator of cell morphogenesis and NO signaling
MTLHENQTVSEIAIAHPETVGVFESLGIDYCCGGGRTLKQACQRQNLGVEYVLGRLSAVPSRAAAVEENWTAAPLSALARHIVERHHAYVQRELPALNARLKKVVDKHGANHPETVEIQQLFAALSHELLAHMRKEEQLLFPHIERVEAAVRAGSPAPRAFFGSVAAPISRMLAEHDDAGELTARIRQLSGDYQPPPDACPTFQALYAGLRDFERDLHQHVHLENNILFPRAVEMERQAAGKERDRVSV